MRRVRGKETKRDYESRGWNLVCVTLVAPGFPVLVAQHRRYKEEYPNRQITEPDTFHQFFLSVWLHHNAAHKTAL